MMMRQTRRDETQHRSSLPRFLQVLQLLGHLLVVSLTLFTSCLEQCCFRGQVGEPSRDLIAIQTMGISDACLVALSSSRKQTKQYNTIQHNIRQYNTIQYNTIKYKTIQYKTIQYNTIQYNTRQVRDMVFIILLSYLVPDIV